MENIRHSIQQSVELLAENDGQGHKQIFILTIIYCSILDVFISKVKIHKNIGTNNEMMTSPRLFQDQSQQAPRANNEMMPSSRSFYFHTQQARY